MLYSKQIIALENILKPSLFLVSVLSLSIANSSFADESLSIYSYLQENHEQERVLSDYEMSGLAGVISEESYNTVIKGTDHYRAKVNILTVDTRDNENCENVKEQLESAYPSQNYQELCVYNSENPYNSVISIENNHLVHRTYIEDLESRIPDRYNNLTHETKNIVGLGVVTLGLLFMMPESVTKWDRDELSSGKLGSNWKENVKNGPVMDKDDWYINYLGHPISGATYHIIARNAGLSKWESFGYSVFMSTVFWEYGLEAFAEKPSIQDLILTPVVGSLLGEFFYSTVQKINANNGELMGSRKLGSAVKILADPSKPMREWMNDKVFQSTFLKKSRTFFYTKSPILDGGGTHPQMLNDSQFGVGIEFKF